MRDTSTPGQRSLQEFQQQLSLRMQQARRAHASSQACLAVTTGVRRWLFELAHTAEMLPLAGLTPVPFTRPWFLGLINHRSQLTGVIDLDAFAGALRDPRHASAGRGRSRALASGSKRSGACAVVSAILHRCRRLALGQCRPSGADGNAVFR